MQKNTKIAIIFLIFTMNFEQLKQKLLYILYERQNMKDLFVLSNIDEHLNRTHTFYEDI